MANAIVFVGAKIGRWTVLEPSEPKHYGKRIKPSWLCVCECGSHGVVTDFSLSRGASNSCGCLQREIAKTFKVTHGETLGGGKSPEYKAWCAMRERCNNPANKRYESYGGRGITVCDEWTSFDNFLLDMGRRPTSRHSLDRINNNMGYSPGNCRWALPHEQMTNRNITRFIEIDGVSVPLATVSKDCGIPANTLRARILKGWPTDRAVNEPVRRKAPNK